MIYHYTNNSSLINIIKSGNLWASDIFKMNDPDEFTNGLELIKDIFLEIYPNQAQWFTDNSFIGSKRKTLLLSCSFSKKSDDLDQWRAYGDGGRGIAIGFDKNEIIESNTFEPMPNHDFKASHVLFYEIIYSTDKLIHQARKLIKEFKFNPEDVASEFELALKISRLAASYKSSFHEHEEEIRFIHEAPTNPEIYTNQRFKKFSKPELKFKDSKHGITPYTEIKIGKSIKEIIIGPNNQNNDTEIDFLLSINNHPNVTIKRSNGKYR